MKVPLFFQKKKGKYGCSSFIDYALDIDEAYFDTTFPWGTSCQIKHLRAMFQEYLGSRYTSHESGVPSTHCVRIFIFFYECIMLAYLTMNHFHLT